MDEFLELQKKCKQYKIKALFRYFFYFIIIIFSSLILYFVLNTINTTPQHTEEKKEKILPQNRVQETKPKKEIKKEQEIIPKTVQNPIPEEHTQDLKPQLQVKEIKVEEEKTIEPMLNLEGINEQISPPKEVSKPKPKETQNQKEIKITKNTTEPKQKNNKHKEEIVKKEDIKEFLKATNIDPNIEYRNYMQKALKAFREEDYNQAIKYSIKANKIKKYAPEPWIIFAQSKYKLGQKDEAIKVLENYLLFRDNAKIRQIKEKMEKYK